uniref:Uncharacterized protein n=1 Tax=Siphoviridae sp. ctM3g2 TaxID=2826255 RepID=A0A8S5LUJ8_9CAUD|nr:MAG TPA: hypothetical protein [Siphoviridae sp. ctM3g2]
MKRIYIRSIYTFSFPRKERKITRLFPSVGSLKKRLKERENIDIFLLSEP